jgi:hypothetical protein
LHVAEQGLGPGKYEVLRVDFITQEQNEYVIVPDAILHTQEGATLIMELRIINSNKTAVRQNIIGACFSQRLAKNYLNSASYLLAALSTFSPVVARDASKLGGSSLLSAAAACASAGVTSLRATRRTYDTPLTETRDCLDASARQRPPAALDLLVPTA